MFTDDPLMGTLAAPILPTRVKGGLPDDFNTNDWVRVLKHGVNRDSTSLFVMPSHKFTKLTASDMSALIAYCSQLSAIDRTFPEPRVGPLARVLTDLDQIPLLPAEFIDHTQPMVREIKAEVSVTYGKYLSGIVYWLPRREPAGWKSDGAWGTRPGQYFFDRKSGQVDRRAVHGNTVDRQDTGRQTFGRTLHALADD